MTTLTLTTNCDKHTPHMESISSPDAWGDTQFTFCEVCENNIDRFYIDAESDRLGHWSKWRITK